MDASSSSHPTPSDRSARRLRADLEFRRIALVLSGGGALGAYEVGVLRVLEQLALEPSLVVGVSVGAINATGWVAQGRRTAGLEATWRDPPGFIGWLCAVNHKSIGKRFIVRIEPSIPRRR